MVTTPQGPNPVTSHTSAVGVASTSVGMNEEFISKAVGECFSVVVTFCDIPVRCLLDPGSQITTVSERFSRDILEPRGFKLQDISKPFTLLSANGAAIPYIGCFETDMCAVNQVIEARVALVIREEHSTLSSSGRGNVFPDVLKQAVITPILKKPSLDTNQLKNYRPVSNIPMWSKVIEKAVASRLNDHLVDNHLNETFQSAYRTLHSTETALLKVKNYIMCALDQRRAVFVVVLDLSAAFDTVDYHIFLKRLSDTFCIKDTALHWFSSYLQG